MKAWRVKKRRVLRWDRIINTIVVLVLLLLVAGSLIKHSIRREVESKPTPRTIPTLTPTITPTTAPRRRIYKGFVSHYSRSGCLGCNKNLITASGETLSDTDYTLAFNWLPMGTKVKITNTRNNLTITARVNDTGGFWDCCKRIADLNLATKNAIEAKTDTDLIIIEAL